MSKVHFYDTIRYYKGLGFNLKKKSRFADVCNCHRLSVAVPVRNEAKMLATFKLQISIMGLKAQKRIYGSNRLVVVTPFTAGRLDAMNMSTPACA